MAVLPLLSGLWTHHHVRYHFTSVSKHSLLYVSSTFASATSIHITITTSSPSCQHYNSQYDKLHRELNDICNPSFHQFDKYQQYIVILTNGQPIVCSTKPGVCFSAGISQISFNPMPYDCGATLSRKLNFVSSCFVRWPRHPSAKRVTLACSAIPGSKVLYKNQKLLILHNSIKNAV